jgi:pimeloyl-ACP methyl ester carboxylesterase
MQLRLALALGWVAASLGCRGTETGTERPLPPTVSEAGPLASAKTAPAAAPIPSVAPPAVAPLRTESWLVELPVPGFGSAMLAPPQGVTSKRPVVVALHGYGDRPDWQCGAWTGITGGKVFVLCPQGKAQPRPLTNFTWGTSADTEREVRAALSALRERFPAHVAAETVLVGYSLGAAHAARLAASDPAAFARVALVEGGVSEWSPAASRRFKAGGGERLLLACTQAGCEPPLRALERRSTGPTTLVRAEYLGPFGHQLGPKVTAKLKEPWSWLAEGLAPSDAEARR